jgi:HAD superfamily hydrolase (TIGR01484 family)
MESLHDAGLLIVPVTGRPAGWCDHIARMWPVDAVVGENGAFYFRYDHASRRMTRRYMDSIATRAQNTERLTSIGCEIVDAIRGSAFAADQRYRETDLAIDFCEDVPPLSDSSVDEIVNMMSERGLSAKVSSIHVNGWFGAYDKLMMTKLFVKECHGIDLDAMRASFVFVGDSPNDASMFGYFPFAIGVANVREFGTRISHPPAYVTTQCCGKGFREAAECILQGRHRTSPES